MGRLAPRRNPHRQLVEDKDGILRFPLFGRSDSLHPHDRMERNARIRHKGCRTERQTHRGAPHPRTDAGLLEPGRDVAAPTRPPVLRTRVFCGEGERSQPDAEGLWGGGGGETGNAPAGAVQAAEIDGGTG
mmetsp:Transcript_30257/g.42879  ORF Transcript_30257/g.42879 Transcript_30257/m.42879 type:complete len:131 (+) Transcript_30257:572-964(+)